MIKDIELRALKNSDIKEVAELHYNSFKGFFLTSLGRPFLRAFYKAVISHEKSVNFGAFRDNELIGFAIGTENNSGFYKSILKTNSLKMMVVALPNLISKPLNIKRLISSLFTSNASEYQNIPVLLSICVSQQQESKGVGKMLLEVFENELRGRTLKELILTTDTQDNEYVNQFYQRNNYSLIQSFFQGKREMNLYHKKL